MSATFLCTATGRPRPTITWYRTVDDGGMPEQVNISVTRATAFEVEMGDADVLSNLTLSDVLPSSAGNYSCTAENDVMHSSGMVRSSRSATLTVNGMHICMCVLWMLCQCGYHLLILQISA